MRIKIMGDMIVHKDTAGFEQECNVMLNLMLKFSCSVQEMKTSLPFSLSLFSILRSED